MRASGRDELAMLRRLAARHSIATSYENTADEVVAADPEVLVAVLRALGVPIEHPGHAAALVTAPGPEPPIEPVVLTAADRTTRVRVRDRDATGDWSLQAEVGADVREGSLVDGTAALGRLPVGFWDLHVDLGGPTGTVRSRVLSAPPRSHVNPALRRSWGLFAPLHAFPHPDRAGHLGDVRALAQAMRPTGGRIVALLPLLATFLGDDPFEYSPYQPVSRRFGSELFLDPDRLPVDPPASLPPAPPTADGLVDHRALQRRADALVDHVRADFGRDERTVAKLERFRRERPDVDDYAAFRAAVERHGPRPPRLDGDPSRVEHHAVAQWLLDRQLRELRADLDASGQSLALDLPVGSHPDGFDVFSAPDRYAPASVGAPPDDFFRGGQNWGFPPPHPVRSRADGHRAFTDAVGVLARHAGVVRIDHILGLHRLWWIPTGYRADEGAYVHYPLDELLAAVCIISHLHGTVMVGENLGTVPTEVTSAMHRHGILGMHEEQFVIGDPPTEALPTIPPSTVAGVNTHDMPPFAGFWTGADLDLGASLGQLDEADVGPSRTRRRAAVSRYRALAADELGREVADDRASVFAAAVERLARSDADQVMVSVEDLLGETDPQNVPGTHREVPNWRRRMAEPPVAAFQHHDAASVLHALASHRGSVPGRHLSDGDPT